MLHLERLKTEHHPMYKDAMALYDASFPYHERRETKSQLRILRDGEYHFTLLWDGDTFVGLALYWDTESFIYIEHLCIVPQLRGRRYGQQVLEMLTERGKPVILEIDPPLDEISVRRRGFYERNGFVENPHAHTQPPFHRGECEHPLVIMSSPEVLSQAEYDRFRQYQRSRVMADVFD